jgi:hypothetical protein
MALNFPFSGRIKKNSVDDLDGEMEERRALDRRSGRRSPREAQVRPTAELARIVAHQIRQPV